MAEQHLDRDHHEAVDPRGIDDTPNEIEEMPTLPSPPTTIEAPALQAGPPLFDVDPLARELQRNRLAGKLFGVEARTNRLGRYEILHELGRGGMGVVYLARDTQLDRKVAIKQLITREQDRHDRRFIREALAMAKLSHPNVVSIYEIDERDGAAFIVMEFIAGQTLRAWQTAERSWSDILTVYKAAARGLIAAHHKHLVHRDFKPDNVMVDTDGGVRVMDFGLASVSAERIDGDVAALFAESKRSVFESLTRTGALLGTPGYMSPEQFRAEPSAAASDQFSFCVALYEGLYRERPFAGSTLEGLWIAVSNGQIREAPAGTSVPAWLRAVVCRGLAVAPADRFESMQALLDAIVAGELAEHDDEREPPAYVFVAHDSRDKQRVLRLCEGLIDHGVRPWLDMWEARDPVTRQQALAEAPALIVFGSAEQHEAIAARIARDPSTVYAAGFGLPHDTSLGLSAAVEFDQGRWDDAVIELARRVGIDHEREGWLEQEAARVGVEAGQLSPFRGLQAFREQDARWMFGRDEELAALLDLIRSNHTRFVTLIGASGSGKSSLLMAGVCPMLRHGVLGDGGEWAIAYLRPGARPCEALAHTLVHLDTSGNAVEDELKVKRLRAELRDGSDTLRLILGLRQRGRTMLVIDQLEELFTEAKLGSDGESDEALAFVRNLLTATQELMGLDGNLWIAATLRADFVQRALEVPELTRALQMGTYYALPPMSEAQIRAAIERPAARVGYRVERKLVDKLVNAAAHQAGRLPLLQHVLRELWARRDEQRRVLSDAVYAETGGLEGAIATAAGRALAELCRQLGADAELATRRLMTRLVHLGNRTGEDTRRRVAVTELGADAMTQRVLEALVSEARVLVAAEVDGVETIELAHEALLREWTTLVDWLDADREALRLRQDLAWSAAHEAAGTPGEYLWGRGRVEEARRLLGASTVELNEAERKFLEASERVVQRRRRRIKGATATALVTAAIVIAVVSGKNAELAEQKVEVERKNVEVERKNAEVEAEKDRANEQVVAQMGMRASMLAKSPGNELAALRLAIEAVGGSDAAADLPEPVFSGLVGAVTSVEGGMSLRGHTDWVIAVAYSVDGARVATASVDKTVRLWDGNTGALVQTLEGHELGLNAVAFTRDGSHIATVSMDKTARIWDVESGKELTKLVHEHELFGISISPDGARLATAAGDGRVRVWDVAKAEVLREFEHGGALRAVAWSPDGTRLVSASDNGTARVWNASDGAVVSNFAGHGGKPLLAAAWSPNGRRVVTGGYDAVARMWEADTGREVASLEHGETVMALAFSPDGKYLAAGVFDDDMAVLWNVDRSARVRSFRHAGPVNGVAWSPDGTKLVTSSWDKTAKSWDIRASPAMRVLEGHWQGVYAVAASADGSRFATASGDDTARLWDASTGRVIAELRGHIHDLSAVAFSEDGTMLATASWDGTARLWDAKSGAFVRTLKGHEGRVHAVAFSPNGERVATASADERVHIWDRASGAVERTLEHDSSVADVSFSPDGTQLFTVTTAGTGHLWSSNSGQALSLDYDGLVTAAAFSPDKTRLALSTKGNEIVIWDRASKTASMTFAGHSEPVRVLAFSRTGELLASASEDGTVRVWDASSGDERGSLAHVGRVFDVAFSADDAALLSANGDDIARVWALSPTPWLAWSCALLDARGSQVDETRDVCAFSSTSEVAIASVMAEPRIVDGDEPEYATIVVHGVEYLFVPGGTFLMGSPEGVGFDSEHPPHEVMLDGFYMARTELTNAQYALFLDANPEVEKPEGWGDPRFDQPNQPVIGLEWFSANVYCDWAGCTLPTEAQWEYAARAGTTTAYWYGGELGDADRFGWHRNNANDRPHSVSKRGANAFGFVDMTGNLWEWALDNSGDYTTSPRTGDGLRHKPVGDTFRIVRGGSWHSDGRSARSAVRDWLDPRIRYYDVGFRPIITLPLRADMP